MMDYIIKSSFSELNANDGLCHQIALLIIALTLVSSVRSCRHFVGKTLCSFGAKRATLARERFTTPKVTSQTKWGKGGRGLEAQVTHEVTLPGGEGSKRNGLRQTQRLQVLLGIIV